MKLVYTSENRILVSNARNILVNEGIAVVLKNEFAGGAMGELAVFETWPELWLCDDEDYENALRLLDGLLRPTPGDDWICPSCRESNASAFETCWRCQREPA